MTDFAQKYELVIGLEIHVQLNTAGKIFSPEENSFAANPNSETHPISLAHPGTLPRLEPQVVEKALKLALTLDCEINEKSFFDRKNYFYPDLPKGYQISQDSDPYCKNGLFVLEGKEAGKMIRIHHIHMEEDAGKSIHEESGKFSRIDLNRAGTPLLEIVTEPDFRSGEEAAACLEQLQHLVRYLDVSEADMEKGHMRCDANVSVRRFGEPEFGTRAEVKNLNSMRFVKKAVAFEFNRQCQLLEDGKKVVQETRGFDPVSGRTSSQREKEMANDYRYFPDPDLAPLQFSEKLLAEVKANLPELPAKRRARYEKEWSLSSYDAGLLVQERPTADFFDELMKEIEAPKLAANWLLNDCRSFRRENPSFRLNKTLTGGFAHLLKACKADEVPLHFVRTEVLPAYLSDSSINLEEALAEIKENSQKDANFADVLVKEVLAKFPKEADLYRKGKKQLLGMFMGEAMKAGKGKVNPQEIKKLLQDELK